MYDLKKLAIGLYAFKQFNFKSTYHHCRVKISGIPLCTTSNVLDSIEPSMTGFKVIVIQVIYVHGVPAQVWN